MTENFDSGNVNSPNWLQNQKDIRAAKNSSSANETRIDQLERKCERLSVLVESLFLLLQSKTEVTVKEFELEISNTVRNRENELSLKVKCEGCGQQIMQAAHKCIYCGHNVKSEAKSSLFL